MRRLGLALVVMCFVLPLALRLDARRPGTNGQRDDGDRDHRDRGRLVINRAVYGEGKRMHDVTAALNADIHDGRLRLPVRNDTMGGDPARNKSKTLQVWYTFNGRQFQVTLNENDVLELPGPEALADHHDDERYDQAHMERVVLRAGTELDVLTNERIDARDVVEGQMFSAQIAEDIHGEDGSIVIPRGSDARLILRRLEGNGGITLDVESISVGGRRYRVSTEDAELQNRRDGVGANQRTGEFVGGGAAIGAIIGAIAGGGRGAAIGAAAGAAAGAGTQIVTQGREVHVPAESVIRFRLDHPLRLRFWE